MSRRGRSDLPTADADMNDVRTSGYAWLAWLSIPLIATAMAALWVAQVPINQKEVQP
jgi:hypothetical protein